MKIGIKNNNLKWNRKLSSFFASGKDVGFATTYEVENEKTGNSVKFNFDHSTGSEWDRATKWIYKAGDLTLVVGNEDVTNMTIENYRKSKMR